MEMTDDIDVSTGFVNVGTDNADDMLSLRIWDEMFVKGGVKHVFDDMMNELNQTGLVEARFEGALPYLPETVNEELGFPKFDGPVYGVRLSIKQDRRLTYHSIFIFFPKTGLAQFLREFSKEPTNLSMIYDYTSWFREYFIRKIAYRYL